MPALQLLPFRNWCIVNTNIRFQRRAAAFMSHLVDVFTSGFEGYPCYRIPAVLRVGGLVMLFAEGRRGGDTGPNDIVYKTSVNEGETWSALRVLHSEFLPPGHNWHALARMPPTRRHTGCGMASLIVDTIGSHRQT